MEFNLQHAMRHTLVPMQNVSRKAKAHIAHNSFVQEQAKYIEH